MYCWYDPLTRIVLNLGILPLYLLSLPLEFVWNLIPTIGTIVFGFAFVAFLFFGAIAILITIFTLGGLFLVFGVLGIPFYVGGFFVIWFFLFWTGIVIFILANMLFGIFGNAIFLAVMTLLASIAFFVYLLFGLIMLMIWMFMLFLFACFSYFIGALLSLPTATVFLFTLAIIAAQDILIFFSQLTTTSSA